MAYKFQLGNAKLGGTLEQVGGLVGTDVDDATAGNIVAEIDNGEIPIAKLAAKTISGKDLGANLDSLTTANNSGLGTITYNGSAAVALAVELDGSGGLAVTNAGIKVDALGVTNAMLAGSIADSKLSAISTANKVEASALELAANSAMEDASGLKLKTSIAGNGLAVAESGGAQILSVEVDDSSIEINSDELRLKDNGVTLAKMAGIARGSIIHGNASGDPAALGKGAANTVLSSDGTDVSYTAVSNAMLAGGIVNAKLVNSDVTYVAGAALSGGGAVALGGAATLNVEVDGSSIEVNSDALRVKALGITNAMLAGSIADSKFNKIASANKVDLAALDLDGGTDIGAALVDADLFIVDDGAGGTNRKSAMSRVATYAKSKFSAATTGGKAEGVLSYNDGAYTFTQMSVAELRAHLSVTDSNSIDMSYSAGAFSAVVKPHIDSLELHANGVRLKDTIGGNRTFSGDVVISGGLTVNGTTTTLNTATLEVEDKNIYMAKGNLNSAGANGAGFTIEMGSDDLTFAWAHASQRMQLKLGAAFTNLEANKFIGGLEGAVEQPINAIGDADGALIAGMNYGSADTTAERTWTLPASPLVGQVVNVKAPAAPHSAGIKIQKAGSQLIDGQAFIKLESGFAAVSLCYVANNAWRVF